MHLLLVLASVLTATEDGLEKAYKLVEARETWGLLRDVTGWLGIGHLIHDKIIRKGKS